VGMCCLCSNLAAKGSRPSWDEPLFESANFIAIPSLGSIVEGWMLIVPKNHFVCMGALPPLLWEEMEGMKERVSVYLTVKYGNLCAFEHGPGRKGRQIGCGVDHAHIHVVPVNFDLISASDYLYVEQPLGYGRFAVHDQFGSQIFRKAIAARAGFPGEFNWRDYPKLENITRTIQACRQAASS
jgi:ATP adenylyltransferase